MKGIILAGGTGTRLYPITEGISKQLMPIYDKPMIYYPLSTLMSAGIRDILVITTPHDQENFKRLLKSGEDFGINISYAIQDSPRGLADAFIVGEDFIDGDSCCMILGDNIFYGNDFTKMLNEARINTQNGYATIFGYQVKDPERFGIMELDKEKNVISIEEKPEKPKSKFAVTGIYFYPEKVSEYAKKVKPSQRGEIEITTLNDMYLKENKLKASLLGSGFTWYDTGTFESELDAALMIRSIQNNKDKIVCCPEEIAYVNKWIDKNTLTKRAELMKKNAYGKYLYKIIEEDN